MARKAKWRLRAGSTHRAGSMSRASSMREPARSDRAGSTQGGPARWVEPARRTASQLGFLSQLERPRASSMDRASSMRASARSDRASSMGVELARSDQRWTSSIFRTAARAALGQPDKSSQLDHARDSSKKVEDGGAYHGRHGAEIELARPGRASSTPRVW